MEVKRTNAVLNHKSAIILVPVKTETPCESVLTICMDSVRQYLPILEVEEKVGEQVLSEASKLYMNGAYNVSLVPSQYVSDIIVIV